VVAVEETGQGNYDTRDETGKIYEVENAKLSFLVAVETGHIPDAFYMTLNTVKTFHCRVHGKGAFLYY
jgi:hypothetical protein